MADNFTDTFTKEETLKALRCCYSDEDLCSICPYENTITSCAQLLKRDAFDIIKSQNEFISKLALECKKAKIEYYKEFTNKLKPHKKKIKGFDLNDEFWDYAVLVEDIENTLMEMVSELNDQ